jgi:hypothetical protein
VLNSFNKWVRELGFAMGATDTMGDELFCLFHKDKVLAFNGIRMVNGDLCSEDCKCREEKKLESVRREPHLQSRFLLSRSI